MSFNELCPFSDASPPRVPSARDDPKYLYFSFVILTSIGYLFYVAAVFLKWALLLLSCELTH